MFALVLLTDTKEESIPSVCKSQAMSFCSVCLDAVVEGEDRSIARLKCGHHFHLDCIGSAFNAKGRMQCPNCRHVEQGRWLYANACCLHEDFFEDLAFEDDAEVFNAAAESQVSHTPWCPHQGSYGHISLTFEELHNFANGYLNPLQNATHRVQVPAISVGHIGPYLVGMHNIPLGRPLIHMEDTIALQMNYVDRVSNHIGTRGASHGPQGGSVAFNGSWTSYGGSSESNTHNGLFTQPNFTHLSLGFLVGSPQSAQAGYANLHPMGFFRSGQAHTRRTRHIDAFQTTQRTTHISPSERRQMSEPVHGNGSFYSSGQSLNRAYHGDRMNWAAESSQMEAFYSYGVPAHWWAWVPHETISAMRNMAPSTHPYHEGQFRSSSASSRSPPSMAGSLEHSSGPHNWVFH